MKKIDKPTRLFLGIFFAAFGLNGLMQIFAGGGFIPMPAPPEAMMKIMGGFFSAVYLMPLVKIVQLSSGLLLLFNRFTNLALVMLAPVLVNILLIHLVADINGIIFGLIACIAWGVLFLNRWSQLKIIFSPISVVN